MKFKSIIALLLVAAYPAAAEIWMSQADEHEVSTNSLPWTNLAPVAVANGTDSVHTVQATFNWIDQNWPVGALTTSTVFNGVVTGAWNNLGWAGASPITGHTANAGAANTWSTRVANSIAELYYPSDLATTGDVGGVSVNHDPYSNYYFIAQGNSAQDLTVADALLSIPAEVSDSLDMFVSNETFIVPLNGLWHLSALVDVHLSSTINATNRIQLKLFKDGSEVEWLDRRTHDLVTREVLGGDYTTYAESGDMYQLYIGKDGGGAFTAGVSRFSGALLHGVNE